MSKNAKKLKIECIYIGLDNVPTSDESKLSEVMMLEEDESLNDFVDYYYKINNEIIAVQTLDNDELNILDKDYSNIEDLYEAQEKGEDIFETEDVSKKELYEDFLNNSEDDEIDLENGETISKLDAKRCFNKIKNKLPEDATQEKIESEILNVLRDESFNKLKSSITEKQLLGVLVKNGLTVSQFNDKNLFFLLSKKTGQIKVVPLSEIDDFNKFQKVKRKNGKSSFYVYTQRISHHTADRTREYRRTNQRNKERNRQLGVTVEQNKLRKEALDRIKQFISNIKTYNKTEAEKEINSIVNEQTKKLPGLSPRVQGVFARNLKEALSSLATLEKIDDVENRVNGILDEKIFTPQQIQAVRFEGPRGTRGFNPNYTGYLRPAHQVTYGKKKYYTRADQARKLLTSLNGPRKRYPINNSYYMVSVLEPVKLAQHQIYDLKIGCMLEAIYFQTLVSNTPIDEDYRYHKKVLKRTRRRVSASKTKNPLNITEVKTKEEMIHEAGVDIHYELSKKEYLHEADQESVQGDWCLRFRGKLFKAYESKPNPNSDKASGGYICMKREWFEIPDDKASQEAIADFLYKNTGDTDKNGNPLENDVRLNVFNINPRWQQLEYGWYEAPDTMSESSRRVGSRYHGIRNGFSYQAPYGFKRLTDAMWNITLQSGGDMNNYADLLLRESRIKLNNLTINDDNILVQYIKQCTNGDLGTIDTNSLFKTSAY